MTPAKPEYESKYTLLLRMARQSLSLKRKLGWSRDVGAGRTKDDIVDMELIEGTDGFRCVHCGQKLPKSHTTNFYLTDHAGTSVLNMHELNVRETEEVVKWLTDAEAERAKEAKKI